MYIIETKKLTKSYGKSRGIEEVSLQVKEGEIFGFVGPNGAGKSTTIRTILNFLFPTDGEGKIFGMDIIKESSEIKKQIGYVPSEIKFYDEAKVKDIIKYSSTFYQGCSQEKIDKLCEYLEVDLDKKMSELSLGNKKKVAIVQALIHNPKLLILDEPANGLDPLMQKKLFDILQEQKAKGTTVFLSSHNLVEVENLCDRVAVIKDGRIIDVLEVSKIAKKSGFKITIKGDGIDDKVIKDNKGEIIENNKGEITFSYMGNIDELIKSMAKFKIEKLLIGEHTLEDTFMDYYISGEEK
ncbi:MAG: ABC transporter ATP-binding protein [Clostridium sp.]|uniref:ABC transporter ATP-binding protein n=1 Tax=Clostridium sp. TaxID=1506 RepID=UPI00305CF6F4